MKRLEIMKLPLESVLDEVASIDVKDPSYTYLIADLFRRLFEDIDDLRGLVIGGAK